jgi:hypothetical protein
MRKVVVLPATVRAQKAHYRADVDLETRRSTAAGGPKRFVSLRTSTTDIGGLLLLHRGWRTLLLHRGWRTRE